jgi:hypothetical protein
MPRLLWRTSAGPLGMYELARYRGPLCNRGGIGYGRDDTEVAVAARHAQTVGNVTRVRLVAFMSSAFFIVLVLALILVPGAVVSPALLPRPLPAPLRASTVFGLGYVTTAAVALVLSRLQLLRTPEFVAAWAAVSAISLVVALSRRRRPGGPAPHPVAFEPLTLLVGAGVMVAILAVHASYLHVVDTRHYVYFLDGLEIANSHGVPPATIQYDQTWPLASDKILLDCFTAAAVLFHPSTLAGPQALAWVALLGASVALWSAAEELGLRRVGFLAPLLLLADFRGLHFDLGRDFTEYRGEDFGRAIGLCALAVGARGVVSLDRQLLVVAGLLLAGASGTHLIAAVAVAMLLAAFIVATVALRPPSGRRVAVLGYGAGGGGVALVGAIVVRLLAPGEFGLEGASRPGAYGQVSRYDLGLYMKSLQLAPVGRPQGGHWYLPAGRVLSRFAAAAGGSPIGRPHWVVLGLLGIVALWLGARHRRTLGALALSAILFVFALTGVALAFDWHYRVYIAATFGYRRLIDYAPVPSAWIALAGLEAGALLITRLGRRAAAPFVAGVAVALAVLTLVGANLSDELRAVNDRRLALMNWVRTRLPCDARILVNARPESPFQALTGRVVITEGMGPFLRVEKLPHVATLFMRAARFYQEPETEHDFVSREGVTHVIVQRASMIHLGPQPLRAKLRALDEAPFLRPVSRAESATVYQVVGAPRRPASPLLRGPYLHCERKPAQF